MAVLLVIGDLQSVGFLPHGDKHTEVRISLPQALEGGGWLLRHEADCLRQLLRCEPTDVVGIVMVEKAWLDSDSIVNAQKDYFTACKTMWVIRKDGSMETVFAQ